MALNTSVVANTTEFARPISFGIKIIAFRAVIRFPDLSAGKSVRIGNDRLNCRDD